MSNEPRWDLIRRVRREIARGVYVTEEKLQITVERIDQELSRMPHDDKEEEWRKASPELDL